ncbi:hypothetical protein [Epibacterium ulvae]|uniref:hypothetical protein n=1 Tax=Epibacterium ulvae TaxID=1156985 RepID=UPI002492B44C|nr:hypothetical protein [Epibacterium ulvae]
MPEFHEINWGVDSAEQRKARTKALYRLMRKLSKAQGVAFDVLVKDAQEESFRGVDSWYKNFQTWKREWKKAHRIHEWIANNHFAWAQELEPQLFQVPRKSEWDLFLENVTFQQGLSVIDPLGHDIASREAPDDEDYVRLRKGQAYGFELLVDSLRTVVAFEEYEGQ